jgi:hypothetical protein
MQQDEEAALILRGDGNPPGPVRVRNRAVTVKRTKHFVDIEQEMARSTNAAGNLEHPH